MLKILVVGGEGYIGSKLCPWLIENGHDVVSIDIGYFRYGCLVPPEPCKSLTDSAANITRNLIEQFDAVVMLAAISNDPYGKMSAEEIYKPTVDFTLRCAQLCKAAGVRFIFPSSCSVYGYSSVICYEDSQVNPLTPYSENKTEIESRLIELEDDSFRPIILRLATVFGPSPRIRFDVVLNMLCGMAVSQKQVILNSNGLAWRPHLYIDDVCRVIEGFISLETSSTSGATSMLFNVGTLSCNYSVKNVAELIAEIVGVDNIDYLHETHERVDLFRDSKIHDGVDKRSYKVNFEKLNREYPQFAPSISVEHGLQHLVEYLRYIKLDEVKFKQRDFYRLQQLEFLHQMGAV